MSFIYNFLDQFINAPREITRLLKLFNEVDSISNSVSETLLKNRKKFLEILNDQNTINEELKNKINEENKELYSLSDYKLNIINELKYLILVHYKNKLQTIIEEGEKECQLQGLYNNSINPSLNYNSQFIGSNLSFDEIKSTTSNGNNKKKKNSNNSETYSLSGTTKSFLGQKKNRNKAKKKNQSNEYSESEYTNSLNHEKEASEEKKYCKCNQISYGQMICCDNPDCKIQWFHIKCVDIEDPNKLEKQWYCSEECRAHAENLEQLKNKKKKKH